MHLDCFTSTDPSRADLIRRLASRGASTRLHQGIDGMSHALRDHRTDALLLDDQVSGVGEWLNNRRTLGSSPVPIIAFGCADTQRVARLLQAGADDYVFADEDAERVLERIRVRIALRRAPVPDEDRELDGYRLQAVQRRLARGEDSVVLTAREFGLAKLLFEHAGEVLSHEHLSRQIWGRSADIARRTLEQHVHRLRKRLQQLAGEADEPPSIKAVYGIGYLLQSGSPLPMACAH